MGFEPVRFTAAMACEFADLAKNRAWLGVVDDVRTSRGEFARLAKRILSALQDDDGQRMLNNIIILRERFEPEVVAMEKVSRRRPAKVAKPV